MRYYFNRFWSIILLKSGRVVYVVTLDSLKSILRDSQQPVSENNMLRLAVVVANVWVL